LRLSYEGRYDSNQSHSTMFMTHVDDLIGRLARDGVRGRRVVEVGCGSGYFLKRLCRASGCHGFGFDPGYSGAAEDEPGARFVRGLYDPSRVADVDVIVCRHVIEHVQRPADFVKSVSTGLPPSVRCYFETPAFEWILENTALWDVFHEHCNYFVREALQNVFRLAELDTLSVERVFEGQYFWLRAQPGEAGAPIAPLEVPDVRGFARRCAANEERLRELVARLSAGGTIAVWGAAAKGATLANVVDPRGEQIRCLTDVNPARHGQFIPGSGHEIVAPETLVARGITDCIVMNPNYQGEIRALLATLGADLRLHVAGLT
jgi:SAM-dependent methyltransferase